MALLEDGLFEGVFKNGIKGGLGTSVAVGLGLVLLGPALVSVVGTIARPVAKAAIKGGLIIYDQTRGLLGETRKTMGSVVRQGGTEPPRREEQPASFKGGETSGGTTIRTETAPSAQEEIRTGAARSERSKPWIVRGY